MRTSLAAGLLAAGLAVTADAAHASFRVDVRNDTLLVKGNRASDDLALRLRSGNPNRLEVDVRDDGSADFTVNRNRFDRIRVTAGRGSDRVRIDESQGAFTDTEQTTLDGGRGRDTLLGGLGDERLKGGPGNDTADGSGGADTAFLGTGADTFVWDPGDGSDRVEGRGGRDALTFNGSNVAELMQLSPNGSRARFTRDVGNIVMDLDDVEQVDVAAAGGADTVTNDSMAGTDVRTTRDDLGAGSDSVIVNGSGGADTIGVSGTTVTGLAATTDVANGERLTVNALGGRDTVDARDIQALRLTADGGAGDDSLRGGRDDDVLLGGNGNDTIDGNQGTDIAFMGDNDDVVIWDPGDGSDAVEGQDGRDTMQFNGSGASEVFDVAANGGRVRYTRNIANIVMDLNDVERVDTDALGGDDTFTANDLSGTDLTELNTDLANDGADDRVIVNGTNGDDVIVVQGSAGSASVRGLAAAVDVTGANAGDDDLAIHGLAGADVIEGSSLAANAIRLVGIGGAGDDVLVGGDGPDTLSGNENDDVLIGGPGVDILDGGPGDNTVIQD